MSDIPADIAGLSFEDALKELEQIVQKLEQGQAPLEDSIRDYERGAKLKQHCEAKLQEAQAKVEKISMSANGTVGTEPTDIG